MPVSIDDAAPTPAPPRLVGRMARDRFGPRILVKNAQGLEG